MISIAERLQGHFIESQETGCWEWKRGFYADGYPAIRVGGGNGATRMERAHRVSYCAYIGPIPQNHVVMHACHNKKCINPQHLSTGTIADNTRDSAKLDLARAREIRSLVQSGISRREVAKRYGVARSTVSNVVDNVTWRE